MNVSNVVVLHRRRTKLQVMIEVLDILDEEDPGAGERTLSWCRDDGTVGTRARTGLAQLCADWVDLHDYQVIEGGGT